MGEAMLGSPASTDQAPKEAKPSVLGQSQKSPKEVPASSHE